MLFIYGETPLHIAAKDHDPTSIATLLASGADPLIEDNSGHLPLYYAELSGRIECIKLLAPRTLRGSTTPESIYEAIESHNYEHLLTLCLAFGPNYCDEARSYPLHYALRQNRVDAVPTILKAGADLSLRSEGFQAIHIAADKGLDSLVKLLLKHGANINGQNDMNGYTALHYAITKGRYSTITLLMQRGADPMIATARGVTALEMALAPTGRDSFSAMMAGGLLTKLDGISADTLLDFAVQARRFNLALMLTMMSKRGWDPLAKIHDAGNPVQVMLLARKMPHRGTTFVGENLEEERMGSAWAALDAM